MAHTPEYVDIIVKLATEYWKLLRSYERVVTALPPDNKFLSVARNADRRLHSILSEIGAVVISYEGHRYSPNLAVSAINADEFGESDSLIVAQTVEPTVLHRDVVVNVGKALLAIEKR